MSWTYYKIEEAFEWNGTIITKPMLEALVDAVIAEIVKHEAKRGVEGRSSPCGGR